MTPKQWAEHLTYVAINRGLYYTGLSDKLEKSPDAFNPNPEVEARNTRQIGHLF